MNCSENPPAAPKKKGMSTGCVIACVIGGVFLIPGLLGMMAGVLFPAISNAMLKANATAVAARGRELYIGLVSANTERESLGLPAVWPKTLLPTRAASPKNDISSQVFKTSTEYFKAIADEEHYGTDTWKPTIPAFDYAKLAGGGVPSCQDNRLTPANNIWVVAANVTDTDSDLIPLLVTRNVDMKAIERVVNQGLKKSEFNTRITFALKAPFANKMIVVVRKGGATIGLRARHATLGNLFGNKELPPRDPSKPPIVYLEP